MRDAVDNIITLIGNGKISWLEKEMHERIWAGLVEFNAVSAGVVERDLKPDSRGPARPRQSETLRKTTELYPSHYPCL